MNIRRTNKDLNTINVEVHTRVSLTCYTKILCSQFGLLSDCASLQMMEHVVSGIEDLCGQWSHYYWKDK